MSDEILERFEFILESIDLIQERFSKIKVAEDFTIDHDGLTLLDSIAMRLQAIGDNIKSINKQDPEFLKVHPSVDWGNIMRLRDIISHHYDGLDHEIIYNICQEKIPELKKIILSILERR